MNHKLNAFKEKIKGKKVAVLGIGISNRPLIKYIFALGAKITAFDILPADDPVLSKTKEHFLREGISIEWSTGENYLEALNGFDFIFRTPRVRFDIPELLMERARGAIITSEMEVFMELCPAEIFGVTGSDGKTTTTTLIAMILEKAGYHVYLGGNIGMPLLDKIDEVTAKDKVVLELSSFQLMSMKKSCDVAVITNISPNHLDVHKDYQEYINAKKNIFINQSFMGKLILNEGNYEVVSLSPEARGEVIWFNTRGEHYQKHVYLSKGSLYYQKNHKTEPIKIVEMNEIVIPGRHNVENYLAAIAATMSYVTADDIYQVATTFKGVAHRLELVRTLDEVRWYNSSIDTSPNRSKAALYALKDRAEKAVLIMGGQDKKCNYSGLGEAICQVSEKIILCGENSDLIEEVIKLEAFKAGHDWEKLTIVHVDNYEDAVLKAKSLVAPGEIVVLTPAGTSYDKFRHFEERGNLFRELVQHL